MLRAGLACAEKVAEFDRAHLAAGGRIGLVQDECAAIVVSAEQPPVTIFTVMDFSLVIGHLGSPCGSNQPRPRFVLRQIPIFVWPLKRPKRGIVKFGKSA